MGTNIRIPENLSILGVESDNTLERECTLPLGITLAQFRENARFSKEN